MDVRADRLVSLVLLLRQRGRLSAATLARELEVSTRTVLRDIEALSSAGVPVFAERGRHGGFELLPGFRTELTGLNHDEALALLTAGRGGHVFGLGGALESAMRKVVDALPAEHRGTADEAARRLLVEPATDLLARSQPTEQIPDEVMSTVRRTVLDGGRLRIHYAPLDRPPRWRTIDPVGLVTVRGIGYLLATDAGADRTYRLSRILAAQTGEGPARRPDDVDLDSLWQQRSTRFRTGGDQLAVVARVHPDRREQLVETALTLVGQAATTDEWCELTATFQDARHALWAFWQLGADAEVLSPPSLRAALHERAVALTAVSTAAPAAARPVILLGGMPTVGKSTLAEGLSRRLGLPWISTDQIRTIMREVAPRADRPTLFNPEGYDAERFLTEHSVQAIVDLEIGQGEATWPGIRRLIDDDYTWTSGFIIEGVNVLPHLVARDYRGAEAVRAVFLGDDDADRVRRVAFGRGIWDDAGAYPDEVKEREVDWVLAFGERLRGEAAAHGLPWVRVHQDGHDVDRVLGALGLGPGYPGALTTA